MTHYLSSRRMTVCVTTEPVPDINRMKRQIIIEAPPIVRKFIGQPLLNLVLWMRRQGGFMQEVLEKEKVNAKR